MIYSQCKVFSQFFLLGILVGVIFGIFRAKRILIKTSDFITNVEDLIFLIISGIIFVNGIIEYADGEIRSYIFIGFSMGIIIYFLTMQKVCDIILNESLSILKKFKLCFVRIFKFPKNK